jgi:hypothetical protein
VVANSKKKTEKLTTGANTEKKFASRAAELKSLSLDPKIYAVAEPELLRTVARAVGSGLS